MTNVGAPGERPFDWLGAPALPARGEPAVPPSVDDDDDEDEDEDEDEDGTNLRGASRQERIEYAHYLAEEAERKRDPQADTAVIAARTSALASAFLTKWDAHDAHDRERRRDEWDDRAAAARERELEAPLDEDGQRTRAQPAARKAAAPRRPQAATGMPRRGRARAKDKKTDARITVSWLKVPSSIGRDNTLSANAKAVAVAICQSTNIGKWNRDLHTDLTAAELGQRSGVGSRWTVARAVAELKAGGHLETTDLNRGGTRYRCLGLARKP